MKPLLFLFLVFLNLSVYAQADRGGGSTDTGSKFELQDRDIQVFPNPFTSYISINAPAEVSRIFVYNTIGTKMKAFYFETGQRYYVGDLPRGIYLVQFVSRDNKILTTRRVSKKD